MRSHRRLLTHSSGCGYWPKALLVSLALGACFAPDDLNFAGVPSYGHVHRRTRLAAAGAEGGLRNVQDLCTGEELTGTVNKVNKHGAFLDFEPGMQGFLHVNKLGKGIVKDAAEFIKVGDKLQVRVLKVRDGRVDVAPTDFDKFRKRALSDFVIGDQLQGTVVGIKAPGMFVDIGAMIDAFLPSANVIDFDASTQALKDVFKPGQELSVKVVANTNTQLDLSMK
ncbi:unnamed protein product [Polarella glacialis]|uniref:S1 motif domain-containing protein n=2 Tax=Polarella glacialis TaxID=89957 RepID=A0A813I5C4_POLGL|nr:unnamed protein product [Polarella glacialis]